MTHEDHCDCGCEHEDDYEPIYINTVTEEGEELTFELLEIFEFEGKSYARLAPCDEDTEEDADEDLLMECEVEGDEYVFHAIEDDDLFERIVEYLDEEMDDDECDCEECDCDGCDCDGCSCEDGDSEK